MATSGERLLIPTVPEETLIEAVHAAVQVNACYVLRHGTGVLCYIRPILSGSGAPISLQPADENPFSVLVVLLGDYY